MKQPANISTTKLCRWALSYALHRAGPLAAVVATMLIKVGLDVLKPWPMFFLIDYVLGSKTMPNWLVHWVGSLPGAHDKTHLVGWTVLATIILFLSSWVLNVATAYANISLGQRMTYDLAADLFTKLQQLSLRFHSNKSVGDTIRRVTADCASVSTIVKDALLPVLYSAATLAAIFAVMWRIDVPLTLLAVAVAPYMAMVFRVYARPMMDRSYAQQEAEGRIYEVTEQTFSAMPVVLAFRRESANDDRFRATTARAMSTTLAAVRVQMQFKFLIGLATAFGTAGILWIGAQHALRGELTTGAIVAFLYYLGALYTPLEAIMYTTSTIQGASGSARRVLEVLSSEAEVRDKPGAVTLQRTRGEVRFENVTFGYEANRAVLREVRLVAKPGETIALVGATGAGKSTLVSLIPRFADPWAGRVLLDEHDLRDMTLKSLRRQIAVVLQEPFLFPQTVAENIAYGHPHATMSDIVTAARNANAHEFVERLPRKYETIIGERGATLSGGERQRLSIARAFLKNAPILILDEPTSALDAATEHSLLRALERLSEGRTTFIIAHRLTTVCHATRIIVLEGGAIVEEGAHGQLLAANGAYARFHRLQFGGNGS
jgi:ATP-binding cassette subfamily B protein/subfamily B ATP-binding cassette protein MsbA